MLTFPSTLRGPGPRVWLFIDTNTKAASVMEWGTQKQKITLHMFRPHLDNDEAESLPPPPSAMARAITLLDPRSESGGSYPPTQKSPLWFQ